MIRLSQGQAAMFGFSTGRAPGAIRSAVEAALVDPELVRAAGAVAAEIEAMPPPKALVPELERLASGG